MRNRRSVFNGDCVRRWSLVATLFTTAVVCFADHPATKPSVEAMFAQLSAADQGAREAARAELMRLQRDDLIELKSVVQRAKPLKPAQAAALRQIVQEIYLSGERYPRASREGFLGVLMDDSVPADWRDNEAPATLGVIVADRIPGFCAARVLLDGDVILGTASPVRLFKSAMDLKQTISGLGVGATVRLLVLRRGKVVEVSVTLDARPAEMGDDVDQRAAFRAKRQKKFEDYWNREFEPLLHESVG